MLFPLVAVGLLLIWIGFVVVDMLGGKATWPAQQAKLVKAFFDSHRVTTTVFLGSVAFAAWGHYLTYQKLSIVDFAKDFYGNYFAEIIGIGATVFLIDRINRLREQEHETKVEKERLITEMGSTDNNVALAALKRIRQLGWLQDGTLVKQDFSQANLAQARLYRANLMDAVFSGANLTDAFLIDTKLMRADLIGADLSNAILSSTDLTGAILILTDLRNATLLNATLIDTILIGAKLMGANLRNANLSNANLISANLTGATYNKQTIWPDEIDPQGLGAILMED